MTRQTRFSILLYIIIALLLVVLWINPVQSWGEYTENSSRRLLLGNAHPVWIEEDNTVDNEGFSLVLIFENFDITTEEITFAVYLSGPDSLPANFTQYKPKVRIENFSPRRVIYLETPNWIKPNKGSNIINHRLVTMKLSSTGHYPFDVTPILLYINIEAAYVKTDGEVEKAEFPISTLLFEPGERQYNIRAIRFQLNHQNDLQNKSSIYFEIIERKFAQIMFVSFFVLINLLVMLILGINELSNLLESVAAVVIGLWGMQNIVLPEYIPFELRFLAEQAIFNTYLLIGIVVILWLIRRGINKSSDKPQGVPRQVRMNRMRKKTVKRRVLSRMTNTPYVLPKNNLGKKQKSSIKKDKKPKKN